MEEIKLLPQGTYYRKISVEEQPKLVEWTFSTSRGKTLFGFYVRKNDEVNTTGSETGEGKAAARGQSQKKEGSQTQKSYEEEKESRDTINQNETKDKGKEKECEKEKEDEKEKEKEKEKENVSDKRESKWWPAQLVSGKKEIKMSSELVEGGWKEIYAPKIYQASKGATTMSYVCKEGEEYMLYFDNTYPGSQLKLLKLAVAVKVPARSDSRQQSRNDGERMVNTEEDDQQNMIKEECTEGG
ncbi:hypothetical protein AX774_g5018, partial [Zancudomyces culisetae]